MRIISIIFLVFTLHSCFYSQQTSTTVTETITQESRVVEAKEFSELMTKGGVILDVRTPKECAKGVIKGSVNINLFDNDFEEQVAKLDHNKPVYIYCARGGRSNKAMVKMARMGFVKLYDLKGGYKGWFANGFPVELKE